MDIYARLQRIKNDFIYCSEKVLKIKDKAGRIVPFKVNAAQAQVLSIYERVRAEGKPVRLIILKARQEGVSTLIEGLIYQRNTFAFDRKSCIIGHESEASSNLFAMFKRFREHSESTLQPSLEHSNEKKLSYKNLKSEIKVYTAESGEKVGRSATIQDLHATEVAFWRNAKESMLALLQTVPELPNTLVAVESTANGVGGWFYDTWMAAKNGENDFVPIFLPWHALPEYTRKFKNHYQRKKFIESATEYEIGLKEQHGLSWEQVSWYRHTLRNRCNNDLDQMKQEYPSSDMEAFVVSGRPVFDVGKCYENYNLAMGSVKRGDLVYTADNQVEFVENPKGYLELFRDPVKLGYEEHSVFAAGVDVAEGLEQGDYSVCKVLDRRNQEVVLTWRGHIDPDLFAEELIKIQRYLRNEVYFCIEMNNHGLTTISRGYHLGLNQYYRQDWVKGYEADKRELGWKTTSQSKPIMVNFLAEWIREDLFTDNDKNFWAEAMTFVRNERGQMQAQDKDKDPGTKSYDDAVIAVGLMIICNNWMGSYYKDKPKEARRLSEDLDMIDNKGWAVM